MTEYPKRPANTSESFVLVSCKDCNGKGVTGKDKHGNNVFCSTCGGKGEVIGLRASK